MYAIVAGLVPVLACVSGLNVVLSGGVSALTDGAD